MIMHGKKNISTPSWAKLFDYIKKNMLWRWVAARLLESNCLRILSFNISTKDVALKMRASWISISRPPLHPQRQISYNGGRLTFQYFVFIFVSVIFFIKYLNFITDESTPISPFVSYGSRLSRHFRCAFPQLKYFSNKYFIANKYVICILLF